MDKETLIKVAVIGVIVLFVLEPIAINFINKGFNINSKKNQLYKGNGIIIMELGSYGRYIILDKNYSSKIDEIKNSEGVESISEFSNKIIVESKDVFSTYKVLKKIGVEGVSDASFEITIGLVDNKELNISNGITLSIEPLIKPGSLVKAEAEFVYDSEGKVYDISNIMPILEKKKTNINAVIKNFKGMKYRYIIDWSNRSKARELGYNVSDIVLINSQKSEEKPGFVKLLGNGYIIVEKNMTNKTKVSEYYDVKEFKDTIIESNESLDIDFAKQVETIYVYEVENDEYGLKKDIESEKLYDVNQSIEVEVEGIFSDEELLYII